MPAVSPAPGCRRYCTLRLYGAGVLGRGTAAGQHIQQHYATHREGTFGRYSEWPSTLTFSMLRHARAVPAEAFYIQYLRYTPPRHSSGACRTPSKAKAKHNMAEHGRPSASHLHRLCRRREKNGEERPAASLSIHSLLR